MSVAFYDHPPLEPLPSQAPPTSAYAALPVGAELVVWTGSVSLPRTGVIVETRCTVTRTDAGWDVDWPRRFGWIEEPQSFTDVEDMAREVGRFLGTVRVNRTDRPDTDTERAERAALADGQQSEAVA